MTYNVRAESAAVMSFIIYRKLRELIDPAFRSEWNLSLPTIHLNRMTPSNKPTLHIPNGQYPLGKECEITPITHNKINVNGVDLRVHHKHT